MNSKEKVEQALIASIPELLANCKSALPEMRNKYTAKKLIYSMTKTVKLLKDLKYASLANKEKKDAID